MIKIRTLFLGLLLPLIVMADQSRPFGKTQDRPNVVYIALEDITPMMGCYGDTYAKTPNFDKLAEEGIRYTHAYAVSPVCSPSRSAVVTGMYPSSLGTVHHRSYVEAPAFMKMIPNRKTPAGGTSWSGLVKE